MRGPHLPPPVQGGRQSDLGHARHEPGKRQLPLRHFRRVSAQGMQTCWCTCFIGWAGSLDYLIAGWTGSLGYLIAGWAGSLDCLNPGWTGFLGNGFTAKTPCCRPQSLLSPCCALCAVPPFPVGCSFIPPCQTPPSEHGLYGFPCPPPNRPPFLPYSPPLPPPITVQACLMN